MRFVIILLTGGALLGGCATTPEFDGKPLDGIVAGETTEAELRDSLGPPDDRKEGVEGSDARTIVYRELKTSEMGSGRKVPAYTGVMSSPKRKFERTLTVHLDEHGVVTDWGLEQRTIRPDRR